MKHGQKIEELSAKQVRVMVQEQYENGSASVLGVENEHEAKSGASVSCDCGWEGNNPYPDKESAEQAFIYHVNPQSFERGE